MYINVGYYYYVHRYLYPSIDAKCFKRGHSNREFDHHEINEIGKP